MTKRRDLLRWIEDAASAAGQPVKTREGASHTVVTAGTTRVAVPRHRELAKFTAEAICKQLEPELGKGWWR